MTDTDAYLLAHLRDSQGWMLATHRGGTQVLLGAISSLEEARRLAGASGLALRIPLDVRKQMEAAGCAPDAWPADLPA